jgi:hypothetical protein
VRRNWQANVVWVELHGVRRLAHVAGVFVLGVEEDAIRGARVYGGPVEAPLVEGGER